MLHFFSAADTYPQNSWSLWSYCFIYSPMFIFHSRGAVTCLPWMTACLEFSEVVFKKNLTTWQTFVVIKLGIILFLFIKLSVSNRRDEAGVSSFVCELLRTSHPGSNWNVTIFCYISQYIRKLIILSLCFLEVPYFAICMNIWGSWRWTAEETN